jgi:hypothetical protein
MCFNEQVSITTYIVGIIGCINLYFNYNLKVEAIFLAWIVQIQLIEYFLWTNQSCNQDNINVTKVGIIINHLQPVVLWFSILLLSTYELPDYVNGIMVVYLLFTYFYTKNVFLDKCTLKEKNHLIWQWNLGEYKEIYYLFFLLCIDLLLINGVDNGKIFAILATVSYILSVIIYGNEKSIGSMWCFFGAFIPWILPFIKG